MTDPFCIREIEIWLKTPSVNIPELEHQDAEWVIATYVRCFDLLPLLDQPNCIPSRRDSLIYALIEQLISLYDADESMVELYTEKEAMMAMEDLRRFARDHWSDIERIDVEMGFGADFEKLVALVTINRDDGL